MKHSSILHLVLSYSWYWEVFTGKKIIEYREIKPYWTTRIWNKRDQITHACFSKGYTKERITREIFKIDIGPCPYDGWTGNFYRIYFSIMNNQSS